MEGVQAAGSWGQVLVAVIGKHIWQGVVVIPVILATWEAQQEFTASLTLSPKEKTQLDACCIDLQVALFSRQCSCCPGVAVCLVSRSGAACL